MCYVKYERYLLAKKYVIVLLFIFNIFYNHLKVFLKTPRGTFHNLTYTYDLIILIQFIQGADDCNLSPLTLTTIKVAQ